MNIKLGSNEDLTIHTNGGIATIPGVSGTLYVKPSGGIPSSDLAADPVVTAMPTEGFSPNVFYQLGTITEGVSFAFNTAAEVQDTVNHYYWTFDTGESGSTLTATFPNDITYWYGGGSPEMDDYKHYEISVLHGIAVSMVVDITPTQTVGE